MLDHDIATGGVSIHP